VILLLLCFFSACPDLALMHTATAFSSFHVVDTHSRSCAF